MAAHIAMMEGNDFGSMVCEHFITARDELPKWIAGESTQTQSLMP